MRITEAVDAKRDPNTIPSEFVILRRDQKYFGRVLLLFDADRTYNYQLFVPGPDSHLMLREPREVDIDGLQYGWHQVTHVHVEIGAVGQYAVWSECGTSVKTLCHQQDTAFDLCLDAELTVDSHVACEW